MDQIKEKLKKLLNINLTSVSKKLSGRKFKLIKAALAVVCAVLTGVCSDPEININFNINTTDNPRMEDTQNEFSQKDNLPKEDKPTVVRSLIDSTHYEQLGNVICREFSDGTVRVYTKAFTGDEKVFEERFPNGVINYYWANSNGDMYLSNRRTPTSADGLYTYTTYRSDGSVLKELVADEGWTGYNEMVNDDTKSMIR